MSQAAREAAEPYPQSGGEFLAQELYGTREHADRFYREQMLDVLTPEMTAFLARQTQMIVASVDPEGHPDTSVRFGEPGFVAVLDERTLAWPELRGNGVLTTVGNLLKNPAAHLMFLDHDARIGLHLRGQTRVLGLDEMAEEHPAVAARPADGRSPERWVVLHLATSYVHCRKHFSPAPTDRSNGVPTTSGPRAATSSGPRALRHRGRPVERGTSRPGPARL